MPTRGEEQQGVSDDALKQRRSHDEQERSQLDQGNMAGGKNQQGQPQRAMQNQQIG